MPGNRLTQIAQGGQTVSFGYDAANRRTSTTLPNGVTITYGYDNANQLTAITYTKGATAIGNLSYTYDAAGRRTGVGGSLAGTSLPAAIASATYNANNQLTNWNGASFAYDLNGNLTADGTRSYSWDSRDQLAEITGSASASFQYDAQGRRASKTVNGTQTGFVYDGGNYVQELSAAIVKANLLTGPGLDEIYARTVGSSTTSYLTDGLGSVVALGDGTGSITTQYTYEPYGKTTPSGAASDNAQQYTGRENDGTGLYYYRNRYYLPDCGRFISEDPIGIAGGMNLYQYVGGNPVSRRDSMGLRFLEPEPDPTYPVFFPGLPDIRQKPLCTSPLGPSPDVDPATVVQAGAAVASMSGLAGAIYGGALASGEPGATIIRGLVVSDAVWGGGMAGFALGGAAFSVLSLGVVALNYIPPLDLHCQKP